MSQICVMPAYEGETGSNEGDGQLHELNPNNQDECVDFVEVRRLDDVLQNYLEKKNGGTNEVYVFAIKMDIEGYETLALRGASNLLQNNAPCYVFVEYWKSYTS